MTYVIRSRGLARVLVAFLALVVGLGAAALPARPAAAGDRPGVGVLLRGELACWEEFDERTGRVVTICIHWPEFYPIEVPEWPPPACPVCEVLGFDFPAKLPPDRQVQVLDGLADGLGLLAAADRASDPKQVAVFRDRALDRFGDAVAASDPDGDPVHPVTGLLTVDGNQFEPVLIPELAEAGTALVKGMAALAARDGDPAGYFDHAYRAMTGRHQG